MLNHTLIGKKVGWEGRLWKVTGARRTAAKKKGLRFRLLPLDMGASGKEVWTPIGPLFEVK